MQSNNSASISTSVNASVVSQPTFLDQSGNVLADPMSALPGTVSKSKLRRMRSYLRRVNLAGRLGIDVAQVGKHRGQRLISYTQFVERKDDRRSARLRYKDARKGHFKRLNERNG